MIFDEMIPSNLESRITRLETLVTALETQRTLASTAEFNFYNVNEGFRIYPDPIYPFYEWFGTLSGTSVKLGGHITRWFGYVPNDPDALIFHEIRWFQVTPQIYTDAQVAAQTDYVTLATSSTVITDTYPPFSPPDADGADWDIVATIPDHLQGTFGYLQHWIGGSVTGVFLAVGFNPTTGFVFS